MSLSEGSILQTPRDYILRTIINNYSPTASVILSTHLIPDVEQVLDEVIFLQNGSVVRQGNVDDLRVEMGHSLTSSSVTTSEPSLKKEIEYVWKIIKIRV